MKSQKFIVKKPYIIAGPCSAESEFQILQIAHEIKEVADVFRAGIWKPRTSPNSFEGVGKNGLKWLQKVKSETGLKVMTEVATAKHVDLCLSAKIDVLWIGARTTVNPFYVQEIANALKGVDIPVFVKNPIHPEIGLWLGAFERLSKNGIYKLAAIHRGFYNYKKSAFRNDPKWEMPVKLKKEMHNLPIICDPSHIAGTSSLVEDVSQTAMDINLDGLMIETHTDPLQALSDSKQQITPKKLHNILNRLILRDAQLRDKEFKEELLKFRNKIDLLDKNIIQNINERKKIVEQIANFKNQNKLTIFQIERWSEILKSRRLIAKKLDLDPQIISEIFELIHKYSVHIQTKIMR
tara:strand:- start:5399 stop:6451 length:1053 start_codon:yes stop_codon:yes gene_type:complete